MGEPCRLAWTSLPVERRLKRVAIGERDLVRDELEEDHGEGVDIGRAAVPGGARVGGWGSAWGWLWLAYHTLTQTLTRAARPHRS